MKRINFTRLLFNIIFLILLFLIARTIIKYNIMLNKLKEIETENANLAKQIEETKKDIEFAKSPEFAEKIAREKFDMIKDGELIIILESK